MRLRIALTATALAVSGTVVGIAGSAQAGLVTFCDGEGGPVTVPNDLVVAAGKACTLDRTVVQGNVTVRAGADLIVVGGRFEGTVTLAEGAYFDATETTITGNVSGKNAYGSYLDSSEVTGAVLARGDAANANENFTYAVSSTINKQVDAQAKGELLLDGSHVLGLVKGQGTRYTDVYNSVLEKTLTVSGNAEGSVLCESEVYGDSSWSGNSGHLQLGADGPTVECTGASFFNKNVDISTNTASVELSNVIIRGNLSGDGNDPAPTGANNRVRGTTTGQFVDLLPPAPSGARLAPVDHADELGAKAAERRAAAKAEADAAGPAKL
ncbi:hypothetical protein [Tenggerimyces flavus]|uniref:Uncharacterized protein n=1 Tax=Tenggerimyces flavus TaxID=1708749 RepID=A0ABV7YRS3_9ACTN|nr:hypothetical protein [Tenggerimyces flavus]MBM7784458.1 hypothetical protein [Tenggerimyces flavus]